jgi:hypothetical protein
MLMVLCANLNKYLFVLSPNCRIKERIGMAFSREEELVARSRYTKSHALRQGE